MSHLTHSASPFSIQRIAGAALVTAIAVAAVLVALALGGGSSSTVATPQPTTFKGVDESRVAAAVAAGRAPDQTRPDESRVAEAIARGGTVSRKAEPYILRFEGPHPR